MDYLDKKLDDVLMTKEQIEMLRCLIQGEIEAALQNETDTDFLLNREKSNDQRWETFIQTFVGETK